MTYLKRILVTGANGFVGQSLCRMLLARGFQVRAALRSTEKAQAFSQLLASEKLECVVSGELSQTQNWAKLVHEVDAVVHLAARVHVMNESTGDPLEKYRATNVAGTMQLAQAAAQAGVKRFVYLSSIKVNGEFTQRYSVQDWQQFTEQDEINCQDPYGKSKWEAEQALVEISKVTGMESVILRPPLVYGRGVKANFQSLLKLVQVGIPLPLAWIQNKRSLVYVENLADAILACLTHPAAAGQTYLVSDNEAVSTADLIRELARALGKSARLWPFPPRIMQIAAKLLGKGAVVDRLLESLLVNNTKIKRELNWQPPYTLQEALKRDFANMGD